MRFYVCISLARQYAGFHKGMLWVGSGRLSGSASGRLLFIALGKHRLARSGAAGWQAAIRNEPADARLVSPFKTDYRPKQPLEGCMRLIVLKTLFEKFYLQFCGW